MGAAAIANRGVAICIARLMDYECFQPAERRKDNFWPGQVEKKAVARAGAAWEKGTGTVI